MKDANKKDEMTKALKLAFEDKYKNLPVVKSGQDKANHIKFFFKKLRFWEFVVKKFGRVVVVINGRRTGKKAVVVKTFEQDKEKKFGHALIAGIDRYPRKVSKVMSSKKNR